MATTAISKSGFRTLTEHLSLYPETLFLPVIVKPRGVAGDDDVISLLCDIVFSWVYGAALVPFVGIFIFL